MRGNERADELAGTAVVGGELKLDGPTVLRIVWDRIASTMEKGVKFGEGRKSSMRDPTKRFTNHLMMGTIPACTH